MSFNYMNVSMVDPTLPGVAIRLINGGGLSPQDQRTLQQIKHANDNTQNISWGFNPYAGPVDHSAKALKVMGDIYAKQH
jgi:hypothetical protein